MSHIAQRRDLSDPRLIVDFARTCGDRENLRNLYLLTFADIRASSPTGWTEWKSQLLWELFERTSEFLETGSDDPRVALEQIEARVERRQDAARAELRGLGVGEARIAGFFDTMPRRYFVSHSPAADRAPRPGLPRVFAREGDLALDPRAPGRHLGAAALHAATCTASTPRCPAC